MRIALATCENPIERDDDLDFLRPALIRRGVDVEAPAWSDPTVDWDSFALVMLSSTWDYHERTTEFREWLAAIAVASRLRNPLDLVLWNLDKRYLRELAEDAGVPTIPTIWCEPGAEAAAVTALDRRGWSDLILKPAVDLGANQLVRARAELAGTMLERIAEPALVQPYLSSIAARGELSLVYLEGRFSHALRKRPASGDFRVQPQYGGTHEPADASAEARSIGDRALAAAPGSPLYARADLVALADGSLALIELELIEPALYLDVAPRQADAFARALIAAAS